MVELLNVKMRPPLVTEFVAIVKKRKKNDRKREREEPMRDFLEKELQEDQKDFEERLIEIPERFRDAQIHYLDPQSKYVYSKHMRGGYWGVSNCQSFSTKYAHLVDDF